MHLPRLALLPALFLIGCSSGGGLFAQARPFQVEALATFDEPWAMTFLPGTGQALVTEKRGHLKLWTPGRPALDVAGVPAVAYGGQGGLADVVLHPDFARNRLVYLSYAEPGPGDASGGAVARGMLVVEQGAARLDDFQVIWRQQPRMDGGQYALRLAFGPDHMLYVSSGERQHFDPAQDMSGNLGKIVRLRDDGTAAPGNPWSVRGGVAAQIWTLGHRNPLGLAFAPDGRLWEVEMGPRGGDELNLIERGGNYGYPRVSNGDHYDGRDIPDHSPGDGFVAPKVAWTPVISPGDMIVYSGSLFPGWRGDALAAGLSGQVLVHIDLDGANAREVARWDMGERIREVEQAPDGSIYLLEDQQGASGGRLLRLTPRPGRPS
jgi:glucose/arabinose dehydrogenase